MDRLPLFDSDLRHADHASNPYSTYRWLRDNAPVSRLANGTVVVAKYADVRAVLKHHELFGSGWATVDLAHPGWIAPERRRGKFLTESDPPEHGTYKALMATALGARAVKAMVPALTERVRGLIDSRCKGRRFDFLMDFAYPLATFTIDLFAGLGTADDLDRTRHWVDTAESFTETPPDAQTRAAIDELLRAQDEHYDRIAADRRANPRDDLATTLATAAELTPQQIRSAYNLITIGGFSSPAQALASAVLVLGEHPELFALLKRQPESVRPYIEELLRMYSAAQGSVRITRAEAELGGCRIPAGTRVLALTASANRDPDQFPDPDAFQLGRANIKSHLGFGFGIHACIGEALARTQLEIVLREMLAACSAIVCPPSASLQWNSTIVGRLLRALPMELR